MSRVGVQELSAIAVALDGSPLSNSALPMAKDLARAFHARILLISVLDQAVAERFADYSRAEGLSLDEALRAYQERIIRELHEEGLPAAGHVVPPPERTTAEAIHGAIENVGASMLIVGSHSRSGVTRVLLSVVAEELIRSGHVPVLVLKPTLADVLAAV